MTPNEFRKNSKRKEHEGKGVKREGGGQGMGEKGQKRCLKVLREAILMPEMRAVSFFPLLISFGSDFQLLFRSQENVFKLVTLKATLVSQCYF